MASSTVRNLSMSPAGNNMYLSTSLHSIESQRSHGSGSGGGGVTFSSRQHGGSQLALLGLQVTQSEPTWVSAGHYRDAVMRMTHVTGAG